MDVGVATVVGSSPGANQGVVAQAVTSDELLAVVLNRCFRAVVLGVNHVRYTRNVVALGGYVRWEGTEFRSNLIEQVDHLGELGAVATVIGSSVGTDHVAYAAARTIVVGKGDFYFLVAVVSSGYQDLICDHIAWHLKESLAFYYRSGGVLYNNDLGSKDVVATLVGH